MIHHMSHGSPPRLMAPEPIWRLNVRESHATPSAGNRMTRYLLAEDLLDFHLPEEAASLLEGHFVLQRKSPGALLYLQCLAAARRDEAFRKALSEAAPAMRDDPEALWTAAAHAWNIGDLASAEASIDSLL